VFGLTTLGVVHTAVSVVAVGSGLVELARHGAITPARRRRAATARTEPRDASA